MSDDLVKRLRDQQTKWMTPLLENAADRIEELEAKLEACKKYRDAYAECDRISTHALRKAVEAGVDVAASLNAAISLLERGGKKAAPSDKMFNQMLVDYKTSLDRFRTTLAELKGETDG